MPNHGTVHLVTEYAFILGRNPELSLAELLTLFPEDELVLHSGHTTVFQYKNPLPEPQKLLDRIGGTTKIIEVFARGTFDDAMEVLTAYLTEHNAKIFGINAINVSSAFEQKFLRHILIPLKKKLKGDGKVRFVNKPFFNVSEVFAKKQRLIEKGAELNCIQTGKEVLFGKTVAIQDFEGYAERDYGKEVRDPRAGMLPPKLAQIMINLAGEVDVIYDPFCGTGTILNEAILMGKKAIGSDIEPKMIEASKVNVPGAAVFQHDAAVLYGADKLMSMANIKGGQRIAIVSEPSLGPPLSHFPGIPEAKKILASLSVLYRNFFTSVSKNFPKGTVIVFIFPYIRNKGDLFYSSQFDGLIEKITGAGFSIEPLPPDSRNSLDYERPDQMIGREIMRLRLK
ncbi:MAG: DNA methyltransferase [Patescibacteria group bacterium]